jgi:hypothetical protein
MLALHAARHAPVAPRGRAAPVRTARGLRVSASADGGATRRSVRRVERPLRLPVWPVVPGVIGFLLDVMNLHGLAAALEKRVGGRVAPMSFNPIEADPFILCVAHRHSFWALDPIRPIFRMLLPEGFPAHPHRVSPPPPHRPREDELAHPTGREMMSLPTPHTLQEPTLLLRGPAFEAAF